MASFLSDLESFGLAKYAQGLSAVAGSIDELLLLSKEDLEEKTGLKLAAAQLVYAKLHPRSSGGVGDSAGGSGEEWRDGGGGRVSQGGDGYRDEAKSGIAYDYDDARQGASMPLRDTSTGRIEGGSGGRGEDLRDRGGGRVSQGEDGYSLAYDYSDAGQGASMPLHDTSTGRIEGGSGGSGSGRGGGRGSRRVLVEVSEYVCRNQKGDFSWMLKQRDWQDTLFIFNENQSCFLEKEKREGCGSAMIRPFRWEDPPRAAGVVIGVLWGHWSGSVRGYLGLDDRCGELTAKEVIDLSLKAILTIIERNSHIRRVMYSGNAATGALGTRTLNVAVDVCEYIVTQLRTIADVAFPAGVAARATGIETSKQQQQVCCAPKWDRESDIRGCNRSYVGDYRSAGILPVRIVPGRDRIEVLLCIEYRKDTNDHRVNILGGKIESADMGDAATTAIREFHEETAYLLPMYDYERLLQQPTTRQVYVPEGKYMLFVAPALESMNSLPERFEKTYRCSGVDHLVWLEWDRVLESGKDSIIAQVGKRGYRISSMLYGFKEGGSTINAAVRDVSSHCL